VKSHLSNAAFGVLDYLAWPAGMLLLAPLILRALGTERYGVWAMATAALNIGAILASGFGDSNIRSVAASLDKRAALIGTVRSTLGIHIALGLVIAAIGWLAAPVLTRHAVRSHAEFTADCLWSFRIAAILMLVRAIETVCVSTQRAFSRYGAAIQVSIAARILSLTAAVLAPLFSRTVLAVMFATLAITTLALAIQFRQLCSLLGVSALMPSLEHATTTSLLRFGIFTWLQSVAGLLFGQADRLLAGVFFGAAAAAAYTFCAQLAQPVYGVASAGLHFLFPHLASRANHGAERELQRFVLAAFAANVLFVVLALATLLLYGNSILHAWAGPAIAASAGPLLPVIAWSASLSALAVTGCYSLLALNKPHAVTVFTILGGVSMLVAIPILVPRQGLAGIANARLFFGPITLLAYLPLFFHLKGRTRRASFISIRSTGQRPRANILGVSIDAVDMERALSLIEDRLANGPKGYICAVGVSGILHALEDGAVADAFEHAAFALPDGAPTVWVGRLQGYREMDHVTGPSIMRAIFSSREFAGYSHFFYGGKPGVATDLAATLRNQFPWTTVAGTFTPPFRDLAPAEEESLIEEINTSRADILWIGISTPRQDIFMRRILPRLNVRLIFGVGAAFDFLSGRVRLCPDWVKRAGLHWLHRLAQDPARLWRRNLHNTAFLWHIALQLSGLRVYPTTTAVDSTEDSAPIEHGSPRSVAPGLKS
jgi:exopolysaccharide biosynthesis WecB/TagA/CpsF family protein